MEQQPPKAYDVGLAALNDLKENFALVKQILKPVLPIIIFLYVLDMVMQFVFTDEFGNPSPVYHLFSLFNIVLMAWVTVHYIMRWHMFTLLGNVDYQGGWSNPDQKYKSFFYKTLVLYAVIFVPMFVLGFSMIVFPIVGLLLFIPCMFVMVYATARLSFILPATVLGHTPNFKEIWDFAKGMVGKTLWAPLSVTWKYILLLIVYFIVISMVVGGIQMSSGQMQISMTAQLFAFVFIGLPALFLSLLFGLIYVGVLSRYYEWGLKNRTDAYGDYK